MAFGHDGAADDRIYKLVGHLRRGQKHPVSIHKPLLAAQRGSRIWPLPSRRLTALMMPQAMRPGRCAKAWCLAAGDDTERCPTPPRAPPTARGLGVETRDGDADMPQHIGRRSYSTASARGTSWRSSRAGTPGARPSRGSWPSW